jgi:hypothetical protein
MDVLWGCIAAVQSVSVKFVVCGFLWRFVAFCGRLWRFVAVCGVLWLFVAFLVANRMR